MTSTCPHCARTLPATAEPPVYCSFCGQSLARPRSASALASPPGPLFPTLAVPRLAAADSGAWSGPTDDTVTPPPPETLGGYRLGRKLGSGGMGAVYEATHTATGQKVAIKLLAGKVSAPSTALQRFLREGQLASQIAHPRCVFVLAADQEGGRPFIVMELMPGSTLRDLVVQRGPLPPDEAIARTLEVIDGLQEAHRLGVVHRDVKPSNCFLTADGTAKVGDFGLSKSLTCDGQLTASGAFLGTVQYASPEQIRGEPVDTASDLYSVCATLYYLLTGRAPFEHANVTVSLARAVTESAPPPRTLRKDIPAALERVVMRGLERDRTRRYESLEELREALLALVPGRLTLGGQGRRFAAFVLDTLLVECLLVLIADWTVGSELWESAHWAYPAAVLPYFAYFTLFDGWGGSPGKRLLRLRVCRAGHTTAPGVGRGFVRTSVFFLLLNLLAVVPVLLLAYLSAAIGPRLALAGSAFLAGLALLAVPMRRQNQFRGLHEFLSGTCLMQLPAREGRRSLAGRRPDRLTEVVPPGEKMPAAVGGYAVRGVFRADGREWVLLGEDEALGRRVLLWLQPADRPPWPGRRLDVARPTRLRSVGSGTLPADGRSAARQWDAFVAPAGCPLGDAIDPRHPLDWAEARPLLAQLADELAAARHDGTLPTTLTLEQVWVQPDGRLHLLDFPLSAADAESAGTADGHLTETERCLSLLRQTATLALEGRPRPPGRPPVGIHAPLPRPAARLLDRLFGVRRPVEQVDEVRAELTADLARPARLPRVQRAVHLVVQSLVLLPGLALMLAVSGLFGVMHWFQLGDTILVAEEVLRAHREPEYRGQLGLDASTAHRVEVLKSAGRIEDRLRHDRDRRAALERSLAWWEREALSDYLPGDEPKWDSARELLRQPLRAQLDLAERHARERPLSLREPFAAAEPLGEVRANALMVAFVPTLWVLGAFLLRGGPTFTLHGIALVRADGRKAYRRQCALRALLVWLPFTVLLVASVAVRSADPTAVRLSGGLWLAALALLPGYAALALFRPARAPHDRACGVYLVPR